MKRYHLIIFIIIYILVSGYICYKLANGFTSASDSSKADTTQINRRIIQVQRDWDSISKDREKQVTAEDDFDYAVINNEGDVLILTRSDMSKSVSSATTHYDIIRDIQVGDEVVGKIIIHNPDVERTNQRNHEKSLYFGLIMGVMLFFMIVYYIYIDVRVVKPFSKMKFFSVRVASGDLDTPLEMDRGHVFGEFTEAFDIMREELKASREREEAAVRSRKELIAELSHDIKTPVASIKAMAEVLSITDIDDEQRKAISLINGKADQIDNLISNLFHATLEELEQLEVNVEEVSSAEIIRMIREADYQNKLTEIDIKDAVILGDMLRLNQVISNIISNSYKYAGTEISVESSIDSPDEDSDEFLLIRISDKGGGVSDNEIESITEKFKRGSNAQGKDGSGLGLYISKYLMEKMDGGLSVGNNGEGLTVTLRLKLA
ncbi:MAG: HAMP domain-containing histidine kinase [Eubacterium sp.]|nr:HAMP domain-containing histidine kinase [Eubacterium sp.]